jgi:hypothetical protein
MKSSKEIYFLLSASSKKEKNLPRLQLGCGIMILCHITNFKFKMQYFNVILMAGNDLSASWSQCLDLSKQFWNKAASTMRYTVPNNFMIIW